MVEYRNILVPMRDGVELACDVLRPASSDPAPAILNFGPYHKDGRGGRTSVQSVHRHFTALGYVTVTADMRGLGGSGGLNPGAFAPGEAQDGHDLVEWIAAQPWCNGRVGMWGVSYPGITALATAATQPPHLHAIVPIHATSDIYRGVVGLGGTSSGFWMRADWGPRMAAYNLMPPQWQDDDGRWARVWAEHLKNHTPWLEAFSSHPLFDEFWRSRVVDVSAIRCPTFNISGWRDLYADCTPRDHLAVGAPRKLLMGPWKHEFPDTGKEAPAPGLWDMQRWFDRWLKDQANGIDQEVPLTIYIQGQAGRWRAEADWPPRRQQPESLFLSGDGSLIGQAPASATTEHAYDPTLGMSSLAWDPWTTALEPTPMRDHAADDARSMCFTGPPLAQPIELIGVVEATLEVAATALPLNLVVKLSSVAANGRSTLITCGWLDLTAIAKPDESLCVTLPLRATAFRLEAGERLRLAVSCADFPRIWPTPVPATLRLFHGTSRISLPLCPAPEREAASPAWGPLQPEVLGNNNDLGGSQTWNLARDLMSDCVRLSATKNEGVRIDDRTTLAIEHAYGAAVSAARPQDATMQSTTRVHIQRASASTELVTRTVTTAQQSAVEVRISIDGQPYWARHWTFQGAKPARPRP